MADKMSMRMTKIALSLLPWVFSAPVSATAPAVSVQTCNCRGLVPTFHDKSLTFSLPNNLKLNDSSLNLVPDTLLSLHTPNSPKNELTLSPYYQSFITAALRLENTALQGKTLDYSHVHQKPDLLIGKSF